MFQRRFRAYNVGIAKSGTTSIAGIFSKYRAAHEFMFPETTKAISDYKTGLISREEFVDFVHARDQKGNLEMDSSSFNFNYVDILVDKYPDAKFIATIRDCYSWLDSMLNMLLVLDIKDWMIDFGSRSFGIRVTRDMISSRENIIRALPHMLDGLLKYWAEGQQFTMDNLPMESSLVIRTDEISESLERIAHFLGVPVDTLSPEQSHLFKAAKKFNILYDMDFNLLQEKFQMHCATLMQKYFPNRTFEGYLKKSEKRPGRRYTMLNKLNESISRGIDFLYKNQLPHGEFPSFRIYTREGAGNWDLDSAIFPTALMAHSLRFLKGEKVHEMRNKAKAYLLQEMEPPGVWRYWSTQSGVTIMPDLDDTCCASAVLLEDEPQIHMENVSTILNNRDENGLFYTFLKPDKHEENDIDSVVNANVLFYIKEFEGVQKVVDYLHAVISENREEGSYWYYLTPASLYYMAARAYANGAKRLEVCSQIIATKIIEYGLRSGVFENETETALYICSLLYLEKVDLPIMRAAVAYLIGSQHENGSWQRQRFYAGPPPPTPHTVWFGSEALTTAFCLEALARVADVLA